MGGRLAWGGDKGRVSLAEHFREDEDENRTAESTPEKEVGERIASGSDNRSEGECEHGINRVWGYEIALGLVG